MTDLEKKIRTELENLFKENEREYFSCDTQVVEESPAIRVEVTIEDGDWKHDHQFCDYLLTSIGFMHNDTQQFGEDDGDDAYSATHIYRMYVGMVDEPIEKRIEFRDAMARLLA